MPLVRSVLLRVGAVLAALSWLVFPGFGLIDLSVSWDADWPVALEAGWGAFATALVGGSFLAVAVRPDRTAAALVVLGTSLGTLLEGAAAGLEWQLLGYAGLLALETAPLLVLRARKPRRPLTWRPSWPLLALALLGLVPWSLEAGAMFRLNRADAGALIGEHTMGVDHHAVQGALALAVAVLALLAAVQPHARRHLGAAAGLSAAYLGLVSWAFPESWASLSPVWSVISLAWGAAVTVTCWSGHPSGPRAELARRGGKGGPSATGRRVPRSGRRGRGSPATAPPCARP
jgi:hypothetical protein